MCLKLQTMAWYVFSPPTRIIVLWCALTESVLTQVFTVLYCVVFTLYCQSREMRCMYRPSYPYHHPSSADCCAVTYLHCRPLLSQFAFWTAAVVGVYFSNGTYNPGRLCAGQSKSATQLVLLVLLTNFLPVYVYLRVYHSV